MATGTEVRAGSAGSRVRELDALRGFALLGIVAVNSTQIAGPWAWTVGPVPGETTLSQVSRLLVTAVFATKFYLLFSFLFGYSFTLQIESARRAGAAFRPRYLRRLGGLFALGIAHAVALYVGDILMTYAVLGAVLLAVRHVRPQGAITGALLILGGLGVLYVLLGLLLVVAQAASSGAGPSASQPVAPREELLALYQGGPGDVIAANVALLPDALTSIAVFQAPCALAMFLFGFAAGRRGLLRDWSPRTAILRRIVVGGLLVGAPGAFLFALATHHALAPPWTVLALGVDVLTAPALSAAYACALLLVLRGGWGRYVAAALAPAGRLALTNYLGQSAILALVFTGYGLALYGRLGGAQVFAVSVAVFAFQVALSVVWMRYLRYGPAEWVLRAVTYARLPSMRH